MPDPETLETFGPPWNRKAIIGLFVVMAIPIVVEYTLGVGADALTYGVAVLFCVFEAAMAWLLLRAKVTVTEDALTIRNVRTRTVRMDEVREARIGPGNFAGLKIAWIELKSGKLMAIDGLVLNPFTKPEGQAVTRFVELVDSQVSIAPGGTDE